MSVKYTICLVSVKHSTCRSPPMSRRLKNVVTGTKKSRCVDDDLYADPLKLDLSHALKAMTL